MRMQQREKMAFDVLIVGAGPAGLAAAIRFAQLSKQKNQPLSICVIEKGSTVGAHLLSGAVLEPDALNELLPDWQSKKTDLGTAVTRDHFYFLTAKRAIALPTPKAMHNKGNLIVSLNQLCIWLASEAENLGVSIFPGFPGYKLLFDDKQHCVIGVQTNDMGLNSDGQPTARFQAGINLLAKQTILAEGCRGSLTETAINKFMLRKNSAPQSYGIGLREVWQLNDLKHKIGTVVHTVGWPLHRQTYGGGFMYHFENNLLALGLVVGLDYQNPYLDPFQELQKFKTHPMIKPLLANGECIAYGAKALNEGGYQAIPKLSFPGGMIVGCGAGFVNVAKIKGIHNAIRSGIIAAETVLEHELTPQVDYTELTSIVKQSAIGQELYRCRNLRPAFHKGLWNGLIYSAFDQFILCGNAPWTFRYKADYLALKPAKSFQPIHYAKPDGKITFDKLTQVYLTATRHREDEPCHLKLRDPALAIKVNYLIYASPESRYCPAAVYEIVDKETNPRLQINFANCIHCKTCDIKDPRQNIEWRTPEGGDGPNYSI